MDFRDNRLRAAFRLASALLVIGLVAACRPTLQDPREAFVRSLGNVNVERFEFATREDDVQTVASLTNPAVRSFIRFDVDTTNVVLRYTRETDRKSNAARTYRSEVVKTGTELAFVVTDIASGEVVMRELFPAPKKHHGTDAAGKPSDFDSLEDCINDFNCKRRGELVCEANRTCEPQLAALTCCLKNGQCFSVHLVIMPTSLRCRLRDILVDFEGMVLAP
jgi:hypothetical protein